MSRSRDRESGAVFQKSLFFLSKAASVAFYWEELGEWRFSILFMIEDESNAAFYTAFIAKRDFFITSHLYIGLFGSAVAVAVQSAFRAEIH